MLKKNQLLSIFTLIIASCLTITAQNQDEYINLEAYDIDKIKVAHIPNHTFINATIDSELNFQPNLDYENFYGNSQYHGNIKKVTEYVKYQDDSNRHLSSTTYFNQNGYQTKIERKYDIISNFYYDSNNNIIKKERLSYGDTLYVTTLEYNKKNQLVALEKKNFNEDGDSEYDLYITIEFDATGNPIRIKNSHPNENYAYIKTLVYTDNVVTISKMKKNKKVREETYVYSKNNKLIKHKYGYHTLFNTYNEHNQKVKQLTYRDNEYCCTDSYTYNVHGAIKNWVFTNHLKNHKEIHSYEIKYDALKNKIYEYSSDNITNNTSEYTYEIEYYE